MKYKIFIVLLLTAGFTLGAEAQERYKLKAALFPVSAARSPLYVPLSATPVSAVRAMPVYVPAAGYYQQHFGFFCKQEWQWEKQTRLPVKLRLGHYEYTQQLEGKRLNRD